MAISAKQQGTSVTCESLIKTRRLNETESFLLEERLKVLDNKKTQKNAEYRVEKYSLQKKIREIQNVRKNPGISPERRKLLRSQGYTIDGRAALASSEDMPVAYKRFSMPDMKSRDSPSRRRPRGLNLRHSEPTMKTFSQMTLQDERGKKEESSAVNKEQQSDPAGSARAKVRHQFRVIEPPCRPGSRRNFIQLSDEKLKELKEKEDKESKETLLDPRLKLDHRGVIVSHRLVKSLRDTSHAETIKSNGREDRETEEKRQREMSFNSDTQAHTEIFEDGNTKELESRFQRNDRKLISKSCESLDSITEVRVPDSPSDCLDNGVSLLQNVIVPSSLEPHHDHKLITSREINKVRKHASTRPPARLAFVDSPDSTPDANNQSTFNSEIELRQPKVHGLQHSNSVNNIDIQPSHSDNRNFSESTSTEIKQSSHQKLAEEQIRRRATLPPGKFHAVSSQNDVTLNHDASKRDSQRLSIPSLGTNVRKSKRSVFTWQSVRNTKGDAVTYAYDARPNQSLCKGYVTMQMTVKGKQVKVHIPKFPNDESEPTLDRARKKVSIARFQPKTLHEIVKSNEEGTLPQRHAT